jgi:uncharacterized protein (TIGR00266 family)
MQGGILSAIGRKLANGESFFNQYIEAHEDGDMLLAPTLAGNIKILDVGNKQYYLNDGAFLASSDTIEIKVEMQNIGNALFGGTGGFFVMKTQGQGKLVVNGYGDLFELEITPEKEVTIDNQHVIAWDSSLNYNISLSTNRNSSMLGNLVNSVTSGEGIVTKFRGRGTVLISSRNFKSLAELIVANIKK